jgi:hypothetical protein
MRFIKNWSFSAVSICLLVLTGVWAWASPFGQISPFEASARNHQKNQHNEDSDQTVILTGTVIRDGDEFTLRDSSGAVYLLEELGRASKFEGKPVKVTGRIGTEAKIIQVEGVELAFD